MNVEFENTSTTGNLAAIAAAVGCQLEQGVLRVPEHLGRGYVKEVVFNPQMVLMIRQYELEEELVLKRKGGMDKGRELLVLSFHNLYRVADHSNRLPTVQVTTAETQYEDFFPSRSQVNTIVLIINVNLLRDLLNPGEDDSFLQAILSGRRSFLYEEVISPEMQDIADEMLNSRVAPPMQQLFYRIKVEQLIFLLFTELLKRENPPSSPFNVHDVKKIYELRNDIVSDLSVKPNLPALAESSGMSESKVKRMFKQIFGTSIYDYYQVQRMERAAYLLREEKVSVSEAGYQLGFSNLSHFGRLFERFKGVKPKKYAKPG